MPVSRSGVMLVLKRVPNGVSNARPPALVRPPSAVWQTAQLPSAAGSGGAIGAIARHGSTAAATPIAAAQAATAPAIRPPCLANGLSHVLAGLSGVGRCGGDGLSACSPRNPSRMRSGVNGGSRKRTPVAS